ncbi:MAG TPA: hypothetical protein PKJ41_17005 [Bryobacteraceae bacterium]|nr:hypothetical protein [Bryobacteraceae bacterium]
MTKTRQHEHRTIDQVVELAAEVTRPHLPSIPREDLGLLLNCLHGTTEINTQLADMPKLLALRLRDMTEDWAVDEGGLTVDELVAKFIGSEQIDTAKIRHPAGHLVLRLLKLKPLEAAALYFAAHSVIGLHHWSDHDEVPRRKAIEDFFTVTD